MDNQVQGTADVSDTNEGFFKTYSQSDLAQDTNFHLGSGGFGHVFCRRLKQCGNLVAEKRSKGAFNKSSEIRFVICPHFKNVHKNSNFYPTIIRLFTVLHPLAALLTAKEKSYLVPCQLC